MGVVIALVLHPPTRSLTLSGHGEIIIGLGAAATSERKDFEILCKLAMGGMAEIFLARTSGVGGFQKYVVLKRILPHFANDERFIQMFLDEARLAALLQHQNIAQVHDIGQSNESYFFTMEYLHGVDARQLANHLSKNGRTFPLRHALTIVAGAAAGLAYAHRKLGPNGEPLNIVHRDVSLSNIFVTYDGGVKIVDFGVARASQRSAQTQTGALKGKVGYMSPEQCRGLELDHRSDLFSLGVVLYALTTGQRPFRGGSDSNDLAAMFQVVNEAPRPPSELIEDYPAELERIVLKALEKSPDDRYASARAMLADIEDFAAHERMATSTSALAGFMEDLYGRPPEPWHNLDEHTQMLHLDDLEPVNQTISLVAPPPTTPSLLTATIAARPSSSHDALPLQPPESSSPLLETLSRQSGDSGQMARVTPAPPEAAAAEEPRREARSPRRGLLAAAAIVVIGLSAGIVFVLGGDTPTEPPVPAPAEASSAPDSEPAQAVPEVAPPASTVTRPPPRASESEGTSQAAGEPVFEETPPETTGEKTEPPASAESSQTAAKVEPTPKKKKRTRNTSRIKRRAKKLYDSSW